MAQIIFPLDSAALDSSFIIIATPTSWEYPRDCLLKVFSLNDPAKMGKPRVDCQVLQSRSRGHCAKETHQLTLKEIQ